MLCKVSCIYQQHVPILQHFLVVVEFQTSSIRLPRIRKLNFARNTKKITLYILRSVCIFSIHFLECDKKNLFNNQELLEVLFLEVLFLTELVPGEESEVVLLVKRTSS